AADRDVDWRRSDYDRVIASKHAATGVVADPGPGCRAAGTCAGTHTPGGSATVAVQRIPTGSRQRDTRGLLPARRDRPGSREAGEDRHRGDHRGGWLLP